jgi:hypothetical protein
VPLYGSEPNVVRETDEGTLDFGDQRRKMSELIADINMALAGRPFPEED